MTAERMKEFREWFDAVGEIATEDELNELFDAAEEAGRLREEVQRIARSDWTAPLCDRLNEFAREHGQPECKDGPTAADLVRVLHGYAGTLKADNERLREALQHLSGRFGRFYWVLDDSKNLRLVREVISRVLEGKA